MKKLTTTKALPTALMVGFLAGFLVGVPGVVLAQGSFHNDYIPPGVYGPNAISDPSDVQWGAYGAYGSIQGDPTTWSDRETGSRYGQRIGPSKRNLSKGTIDAPVQRR